MISLAVLLFVAWTSIAAAATTPDEDTTAVTLEALASQSAAIERTTSLSDEQKQQLLAKIDDSRSLLDEAARISKRTEKLQTRIREAPDRLKKLRASMDVADLALKPDALKLMTVEQLEAVLSDRQQRLAKIQGDFAEADRALSTHLTLARTIGSALSTLENRLAELPEPVAKGGTDLLLAVESTWQQARREELEARIDWTRIQQNNLTLLTELAQRERDLASAKLNAMNSHVGELREYVQQKRQALADSTTREALAAISDAPDPFVAVRREISGMAIKQAELVTREIQFESENERLVRLLEDIKRARERLSRAVDLGGPTAEVSSLLQKRRAFAPSAKKLSTNILEYQDLMSNASLAQLELDEQLRDTRDSEQHIAQMFDAANIGSAQRPALMGQAQAIQQQYHETLLNLWTAYTRYISKLSLLDANTLKLMEESKAYRSFIDDQLLWLPSTELLPIHKVGILFDGLRWFALTENLARLAGDTELAVTSQKLLTAIWLFGLLGLLLLRRHSLNDLSETAAATRKVRTDRFFATVISLLATLILLLPLPWAFIGAGWLLGRLPDISEYTAVVAAGLQGVGHTLLMLRMLRQICRTNGLARSHLFWHPVLCDHLGRQATWLAPLVAPLAFFSTAGTASVPSVFIQIAGTVQSEIPEVLALGRLSMNVTMLLLAVAIYRIWRKQGPVIQAMAAERAREKWASYHVLWFIPAIAVPILLALVASVGYYYTSAFLVGKAGETIWFILMLVLTKDLIQRSLYITQRRLRFQEALRYREELLAQRSQQANDSAAAPSGDLPLDEEKIDYGELGDQVSKLIKLGFTITLLLGLWLIWHDVIPALNFLDRISLPISTTKLIDGVSTEVQLTLGDMVAGLLLGGLALFAARNIPALLELTLLQRLPMSRASRYAFTTLTQYVVAMVGLVISFKALGLQWSSIQWLVAALSVGLGFGLQEIVANFISGIILLFEQPIRVGDVVTVENTTGTVSRIRIRATTIVNWERQELVIPNKSFITGQLINWTLTDTVNRLLITVGVGYESDTRKAMRLMAKVAAEHPRVIDEPPPLVSFEGFGDNALTLNMRAYLNAVEYRIQTITELHQMILDEFRKADIPIAFPQRDLHLDTNRPLELVLRKDIGADPAPS